ncbi:hypothetical protein [Streptomyces sp. TRM49041]|uniref:hypothetical protein n=1 Tax=Streptomyces sp. TRM49041 TaxID=2603216 RepID=UPI0011ED27D8|nr:hypothetical protein [Streptomyces sp. TRM49041]
MNAMDAAQLGPSEPAEPVITLRSDDLFSKFGFNDGARPDGWEEYVASRGFDPDEVRFPLLALVRRYLVPALDQEVTVMDTGSFHNPARAATVDGVDFSDRRHEEYSGVKLTPETVTVPLSAVLELAREEQGLTEPPGPPRSPRCPWAPLSD